MGTCKRLYWNNGEFYNKKTKWFCSSNRSSFSVRQFVEIASKYLNLKIYWQGKGLNEVGYLKKDQKEIIIKVDKNYFRPNEVEYLRGDASFKLLKFKPKYTFKDLVKDMIESDLKKAKKELQK